MALCMTLKELEFLEFTDTVSGRKIIVRCLKHKGSIRVWIEADEGFRITREGREKVKKGEA